MIDNPEMSALYQKLGEDIIDLIATRLADEPVPDVMTVLNLFAGLAAHFLAGIEPGDDDAHIAAYRNFGEMVAVNTANARERGVHAYVTHLGTKQ